MHVVGAILSEIAVVGGLYGSFYFYVLFFSAEFIANDRPIIASYKGELLFPVFFDYPDEKFGGDLVVADFRDPFIQNEIAKHGWALWPLVRYSYNTVMGNKTVALAPPFWLQSKEERCINYTQGSSDPECTISRWNWLGTDDLTRDIFARVLYGFRVSIAFSILLTVISTIIGVTVGAIQGYFGGWVDLILQRLIEIWSSVPSLYLVIIMAAVLTQGFWVLLGVMLLFQWVILVGVVRVEFCVHAILPMSMPHVL